MCCRLVRSNAASVDLRRTVRVIGLINRRLLVCGHAASLLLSPPFANVLSYAIYFGLGTLVLCFSFFNVPQHVISRHAVAAVIHVKVLNQLERCSLSPTECFFQP